jgi:hypothetical protein
MQAEHERRRSLVERAGARAQDDEVAAAVSFNPRAGGGATMARHIDEREERT